MNPYMILGAVIFLAVACAGSAWEGHSIGVNSQKAEDQAQFDQINASLTQQKADAHAKLEKALGDNLDVMSEREEAKAQLEKEREIHRTGTNALRTQLAFAGMRLPAETSGCGGGGGGTETPASSAPGDASPAFCVVSAAAAQSLRDIAFDADTLRDDYKLLYDWAHSLK